MTRIKMSTHVKLKFFHKALMICRREWKIIKMMIEKLPVHRETISQEMNRTGSAPTSKSADEIFNPDSRRIPAFG